MSKRELILQELEHLPERDIDKLLTYLLSLKETRREIAIPALAAESALAKDWLTAEEDAAWEAL
jgi:hypothetical protein